MSDKSFQYRPSQVPQSPAGLLDWLRREFQALYQGMQTIWDMPVLSAEPPRPRRGMVRYADGTDWDPGQGEGLYTFDGTDWVKDSGGGGGVTVHDALTGRSAADQHPTSAISGLDSALAGKAPTVHVHAWSDITSGVPSFITSAGVTYEALSANGDVGAGAAQVAQGNHGHIIANVSGLQTTLDGKVTGPASAVNNRVAVFDGTTGKLVKDGGSTIADLSGGGGVSTAFVYATSGPVAVPTSSPGVQLYLNLNASVLDPTSSFYFGEGFKPLVNNTNVLIELAVQLTGIPSISSTRTITARIEDQFGTFITQVSVNISRYDTIAIVPIRWAAALSSMFQCNVYVNASSSFTASDWAVRLSLTEM